MIAGLEAGADDCLSKPIRRAILAAKLAACARQLALQADMNNYRAEQEVEIEFARGVIERQVKGKAVADSRVRYLVIPTTLFSGDIVAVSRSHSAALYALLADATGHGLAAAISVLPVLQVFFGMAAKNLSLGLMAGEINRHLMSSLPVGRFVAASIVRLGDGFGELWVGGTPGDQLVLCSDGLFEAQSPGGEAFGSPRLEAVLKDALPTQRHDAVRKALDMHLDGASAHDDVSLMVINLE